MKTLGGKGSKGNGFTNSGGSSFFPPDSILRALFHEPRIRTGKSAGGEICKLEIYLVEMRETTAAEKKGVFFSRQILRDFRYVRSVPESGGLPAEAIVVSMGRKRQ